MKTNIKIIIPVHEFNDTVCKYLDTAIESVKKQVNSDIPDVVIVCPSSIKNVIDEYIGKYDKWVSVLDNSGSIDYQSQVNYAVSQIDCEYFTVLEYDDEISNTYIRNASRYIQSYDDVDVFLMTIIEVDSQNKGIKLTNEVVWSKQFIGENGELGFLNMNSLKQYTDFKLSGAIIKKSAFIDNGGYKSNIRLTFMLEFLMRMLNNSSKIYTIPKICYKHLMDRKDSLFQNYSISMSMSERKFWFETALKEYLFNYDRDIVTPITKE